MEKDTSTQQTTLAYFELRFHELENSLEALGVNPPCLLLQY